MHLVNYNFNERTKHAYLILCHDKFDLLKKQLTLLDDERNDIYIHVDRKTENFPKQELENAVCKSKVFWVKRISVNWGGYSQIEAELSLLEEACTRKYSYYHLISGMDLPIKTQDFIHKFFVENYGKEYVRFDPDYTRKNEYENRVKYYYFFQDIIGRNNGYQFYILDKIQAVLLKVQKVLQVNRLKSGPEIRKGTNWFSITHKFAEYVISEKNLIEKKYKFSHCADEIFLQTILWNSPFKYAIEDNSLRLIDWKRGNPYTFLKSDYDEIVKSDKIFARKFDPNIDSEIIDMIYKKLKNGRAL